jgi:hypothetical protein
MLYQKIGISWKPIKIVNATITETAVSSGTYALCAVNKMALESIGVFIEI